MVLNPWVQTCSNSVQTLQLATQAVWHAAWTLFKQCQTVSWPWPFATLTMHSRVLSTIPEPTSSFLIPNTCSWSHLITSDPIRLNLIACIYLSLVLVSCLSLPHICYSTSISFPLSDSLSSPPPSTLYHLTLNCLPSYSRYILHSSPYIRSLIPNLSWYVPLSTHSISSCTLVPSSSAW